MIQEKIKQISNYPIGKYDYDWFEQLLIIDVSKLSINEIENLSKLLYNEK